MIAVVVVIAVRVSHGSCIHAMTTGCANSDSLTKTYKWYLSHAEQVVEEVPSTQRASDHTD